MWWSVTVRVTLESAAAKQAGFSVPTSTYPLGEVSGRTVLAGTLVAGLAVVALVLIVLASRRSPARMGPSKKPYAAGIMCSGAAILVTGLAAMFAGNFFVIKGIEGTLSKMTHGAVTTIAQFQERIGNGAKVSFSTAPEAGVLVVMLAGIAMVVGGALVLADRNTREAAHGDKG
jgi:hypothetical protein